MQLLESKSILAKLMATENLVVEQRKVDTASFDVKNRVLTLPILDANISSELYDLFTGHEVGHALYTPQDGMQKAMDLNISMSIANVVEDSRIERKIKYKYPGLRNSFVKAYKELMEKNFFGVEGVNLDGLNLIDRINLHCKGGASQVIHFDANERELLNQVETTQTYDDVIQVSLKLMEVMRKQEEEKEKQKQKQKSGAAEKEENGDNESDTDGSGSDNVDNDLESLKDQLSNKQASDKESDQSDNDTPEQNTQKAGGDGDTETDKQKLNGQGVYDNNQKIEDKLKSFTDEAFKRNEKSLMSTDVNNYYYGNIPKIDLGKAITDYKVLYAQYKNDRQVRTGSKEDFAKLRRDTNKVVSYLAKEFEMRKSADQLKRASVAKTGDLNMNKIFSYQFSEDIFKKVTVVPGGKSHGLVMFIDWSGSMCTHIDRTMKQLISLVMFCKKIGIPYEVYAFLDGSMQTYIGSKVIGDITVSNFQLLNIFSSRMTASEFTYAGSVMVEVAAKPQYAPTWLGMGSTPLNESIICAMQIIPEFQKKYKLQMVNAVFLTDGEGDTLHHVWEKDGFGNTKPTCPVGYRNTFIIRDPITKHQELVNPANSSKAQTAAYIKLLKARTNCNVLGFYVLSGRDFSSLAHHMFNSSEVDSKKERFRKDRSLVVTNAGFDEYYLLRSESLDTGTDTEFTVAENATTKSMVSAFSKYTNNRVTARVVLNRFIGMIT